MTVRFLILLLCMTPTIVVAHDDHEPLPTKGATVKGDRLKLSPAVAKAIGLQTAKVTLAEVARSVGAPATIELPWSQESFVTTLVAGRIEQVLVRPGDSVEAGQELARIASSELDDLQLAMLQANTAKANAARILQGQMGSEGAVPEKIILQTRADLQQHSANFNTAWQKLRAIGLSAEELDQICSSKETVKTLPIQSPRRGVVAMAEVRIGQIVQPTQHLYRIVDPSHLWIVAKVLEADAGQLKPGLALTGSFSMAPNKPVVSKIDHIELRLGQDRTLAIKAWVDNTDGLLKPGMYGRVKIQLASEKMVLCPKESLIRDGELRFALVEQTPGTYVRKPVRTSGEQGERAIIEDGLFPGDPVITVGSHELARLFAPAIKSPGMQPGKPTLPDGVLFAQAQVEIPTEKKSYASAPIEGRVKRITVEHGQLVQRGDTVAEIESLPFKNLQLEFLQTLVSLRLAKATVERLESLHQTAAIPARQLWDAQTMQESLTQSVAALRHKLSLLGMSAAELEQLEKTDLAAAPAELSAVLPIRAPTDGVIAEFSLVPGQVVSKEGRLFELHDPAKVWVRAYLFEADAAKVHVGQPAELRFIAAPALQQSGRIARVSPVLQAGQRAMSVWIELDNPALVLREGMAATVGIELGDRRPIARN